jgi:hypothetical protein
MTTAMKTNVMENLRNVVRLQSSIVSVDANQEREEWDKARYVNLLKSALVEKGLTAMVTQEEIMEMEIREEIMVMETRAVVGEIAEAMKSVLREDRPMGEAVNRLVDHMEALQVMDHQENHQEIMDLMVETMEMEIQGEIMAMETREETLEVEIRNVEVMKTK